MVAKAILTDMSPPASVSIPSSFILKPGVTFICRLAEAILSSSVCTSSRAIMSASCDFCLQSITGTTFSFFFFFFSCFLSFFPSSSSFLSSGDEWFSSFSSSFSVFPSPSSSCFSSSFSSSDSESDDSREITEK